MTLGGAYLSSVSYLSKSATEPPEQCHLPLGARESKSSLSRAQHCAHVTVFKCSCAAERGIQTRLHAETALCCAETKGKHWPITKKKKKSGVFSVLFPEASLLHGMMCKPGPRHQWLGLRAQEVWVEREQRWWHLLGPCH